MLTSVKSAAMNQTLENGSKTEINVDIENATVDRDENLAKIEIATLAIIFLVTVLGNGTVLLALWTRRRYAGRKKLSRMYFFILHLSIADLITAFLSVLPQLGWEVTYRFNGGFVLCKIVKYGQTLGPYLSSYVLMATAIDRHQAICYPLTYCSWTSRRSKVMVWLAWATSLAFCIPQAFEYVVSDGTSNKGHLYERKLAALYALRLCNSGKQFNLLINAKGFDKWDDMVILVSEGGQKELNCFQLKHVTGNSNSELKMDMFEPREKKSKCICDLSKLFKGFQKVKELLQNTENNLFPNIDRVNLILLTNIKGKLVNGQNEILGCSKLFQTKEKCDEDVVPLDISRLISNLGNEEERQEFLSQWIFSGNEAAQDELNNLIIKEFYALLQLKRDQLLADILKQYLEYIVLWTDGELNGYHTLTAKHIHFNLAEILASNLELMNPPEEAPTCFTDISYVEWNTIITNKSLIVLQCSDSKRLSFVFAAIVRNQDIFEASVMEKILRDEVVDIKQIKDALKPYESDLCYYLSKDIISNLQSLKSRKLLLWKLGLIPLVIKARNNEDVQIIQAILRIAKEQKVKMIVIVDSIKDRFPLELKKMESSMICLNDIEDVYATELYNHLIHVHGHGIKLQELVDTCPKVATYLTTDNIIQLLTTDCNVGTSFEYESIKTTSHHIPRQIPAIGLNTEILKSRTDILIIYGCEATVRTLEYIPDVDVSGCWEIKKGNTLTWAVFVRHRIVLIANDDDADCCKTFENVCLLTSKNVHLIKLHLFGETVLLQWISTKEAINTIRKFRISSEKLPKLDITSLNGTVNVLSADPGYGKTEMMYQLAIQQTNQLVVFIRLVDQGDYFLKTEATKVLEQLRYFFDPKCMQNDLQANIFDAYLSMKLILVIIDGIDEISTECKNEVLKFVRKICDLNLKLWITSRVCVQEEIENEVGTLAFTLNSFNESEQREFLRNYNFTDEKIKSILNDKPDIFEVPLYLYMFCESSSDSSNILSLCDNFIQAEIKKYFEINKLHGNLNTYLIKKLNKFIGKFALYNTFPKNIINDIVTEESIADDIEYFIRSGYSSFGLIRKFNVNDQDQYVFVHKTIGDYIAAKALIEIDQARYNTILMEYLFDAKLMSLRYIFYQIILENENGSTLKQAVLANDYDQVSSCLEIKYSENVKEDFTTSLHLAAQWGRRHYYSTDSKLLLIHQRCYRSKGSGTEEIVQLLLKTPEIRELINKKDKFLSWTPIQYADHSGSLEILEHFSTVEAFNVHSSQLLAKMPQDVLLYFCIKYHYNNLFRLLYNCKDFDSSICCTASGNTLLHTASAYGNLDVVEILLNNISPNVLNKQKETPLHVAAYGHQNVVSFLISNGSHLELRDNGGYTPLHSAVKYGQEEIVKLLIDNNACLKTYTLNGYSLLHTAAYCNNVTIVSTLMDLGANVGECDNEGNLPLHTAVEWNSVECVKVLVDKSSNVNKANNRGTTPLHLAVLNDQFQLVKMLISGGADANTVDFSVDISPSIANYIKPLVQKEFTSRSALDSGGIFELKMAALMSLRFCGSDSEEMFIAMNVDECGVFSDIVLHCKNKDNRVTYLIQLKHQETPKNIKIEEFQRATGNYSLVVYRDEIDNLTKLKSLEKRSFVVEFLNNSNVMLILFTNRNLEVGNNNFLQKVTHNEYFPMAAYTNDNIHKIKLSPSSDKFDVLYENLYLVTNQVSPCNVDGDLENAFKELVSPLELPPKLLQQYIKRYLLYVGKLAQNKLHGSAFLSKQYIIIFLTDLMLSRYLKISEDDKVNWPSKSNYVPETISNAISDSESLIVLNANENTGSYLYQEIVSRLTKYWNTVPKTKTWTRRYSEEQEAAFYRSNQRHKYHLLRIVTNTTELSLLNLYKCMWIEGKIPLVLEITSEQDCNNVFHIHKLSDRRLKLILLNRTNSVITP